MNEARILWSCGGGKAAKAAMEVASNIPGVAWVEGLTDLKDAHEWAQDPTSFDVIVDFAPPSEFNRAYNLARETNTPLFSGTKGLNSDQFAKLEELSHRVAVFRSDIMLFAVKKFIDDVVAYASTLAVGMPVRLFEALPKDERRLPTAVASEVIYRTRRTTERKVEVQTALLHDDPTYVWTVYNTALCCTVTGSNELVRNVISTAAAMNERPPLGRFYTLNDLWDAIQITAVKPQIDAIKAAMRTQAV